MNTPDPIASDRRQSASDRLNQTCLCVTLDRVALWKALEREARDPAFVSRKEAMETVYAWMKTFGGGTVDERVALAEAARPS